MEVCLCPAVSHNEKIGRLPTHVWHAKRFHMIELYGWHLPLAPTEKKLRQTMKIANGWLEGTVVWDVSNHKIFRNSGENKLEFRVQIDKYEILHALDDTVTNLTPETELR